jgi:hypothetical protein
MDGDAASSVAGWKPARGTPEAAGAFARAVVAAAGPGGRDRAKCLLWAASKLASWAIGPGMDPAAETLLHPSVIERFAAHAPGDLRRRKADAAHQPAVPGQGGGAAPGPFRCAAAKAAGQEAVRAG